MLLPASVTYGGIEVEYDTPKGSIITSVQSGSTNGEHVFEVPMFDPEKMPSSAGGFPWKADGDFRTVVYIKNETDAARKYTVHLLYDGGQYSLGVNDIAPHQTVAVDFRELRDSQTPDSMGRAIPSGLETGQIAWSVKGADNKTLSGRSEQISTSGGVASTYACYNCCPDSVYQTSILPSYIQLAFGASEFLAGQQTDMSCNQTLIGPYVPSGIFWNSNNVNVATVDGGQLYAAGTGNATITATWEACLYWVEGGYCTPVCDQRNEDAQVEVVSVQKIQYKVNGVWTDVPSGGIGPICNGTSVSFKAIPTSGTFPSGQPIWGGDASGSGEEATVTFSTAGSRTVSATSGSGTPVSITANVGPTNSNTSITWSTPNRTTNSGSGDSTTSAAPFVPEYVACADLGSNEWKLRVKKITGGTNINIFTGGYRDPSASPPISQAEAVDANTKMNLYYNNGKQAWHTTSASDAHENYHNSEWTCSSNHHWGPTETVLEQLKVSYTSYNSESAAITQMRTGTAGADAKITAFRNASQSYWSSLSDAFGSRPYAAGQIVLNGQITNVVTLANTNGWTGVPGVANSNPNVANPCYLAFPPYNP